MINRIISGGQTGADMGGLMAALDLGIETGGWCPLHCRTERGRNPSLITIFGLRETRSAGYAQRTRLNVTDSAATLLVTNRDSAGSRLTKWACGVMDRPVIEARYLEGDNPLRDSFRHQWLTELNRIAPMVLNVAGNRESVAPGICEYTRDLVRWLVGCHNGFINTPMEGTDVLPAPQHG